MLDLAAVRPDERVVYLLCGVAGSGKTTLALELERRGVVRLSIDEEIWARFGRYGVDYPAAHYPQHQAAAEAVVRERLVQLLRGDTAVVLDLSFWQRSSRDAYKQLIERSGWRWRLLYLEADDATLRRRLRDRATRFDANAAMPIDEDTLQRYLRDFEPPHGEGEEVLAGDA